MSRPFYKRQFVKLCFTLSVLAALVIGAFAFWKRTPALQEQPPLDNSGIETEPAVVEPTDDELPPAPLTGTISFRILDADLGIEGLQSTVDDNVVTPKGHNEVWRLERVAVGTHTVALLHADYEPWSQEITVQDQERTLVDVTLEPKPMTLTLEVFGPSQYELFVDGELADSSDNWVSLPPGLELALEVRAAGFMPATRTLTTNPNGADTWTVVLEKLAGPETGQPWTVPELELEMVFVSPGQFLMGSPADEPGHQSDEEPQTWVTLTHGYWLGKYEVTQGEWAALMDSNPSYATSMGEQAPVEQVTWDEAMAFCQKLTEREQSAGRLPASLAYTLPTEAQWEYACRAGTTEAYAGNLDALAWYADNSGGATHEVGEKLSNEWGFYDMHGNVWEWCADWYAEELPGGFVDDPTGRNPGANRINRGGGCGEAVESCRSAYRSVNPPDFRYNALGFRLALSSVP